MKIVVNVVLAQCILCYFRYLITKIMHAIGATNY